MSGQVALMGLHNDDNLFQNQSRSIGGVLGNPLNGNWDSPSRLTFSFAPDGTRISMHESSLYKSFGYLLEPAELNQTIGNAFQMWAEHSSINFGQVKDYGDQFGLPGLTQGDTRFGDMRIGAIPLGDEVFAVAAPFELGISGTWSGNILFNSNAKFKSAEQFFSVALHEIGHALGLPHTDDAADVMNPSGFQTELSANDIRLLTDRYGVRALDQYDVPGENNNSFDDATRIRLAGSLKGGVPLVAYGDIDSVNDQDVYELEIYSGYSGSVSFRVVSSGISQLAPAIAVFDESGNSLSHYVSQATKGDNIVLTVTPTDDRLYIRVIAGETKSRQIGSYALVALFDSDVSYKPDTLQHVIRQDFWSLDQDELHPLFLEEPAAFDDDLHTNDTLATATDLEPVTGSLGNDQFRVQAGLADSTDIDFYRFEAPENSGGTLTATLVSIEQQGLVGDLQFYNAKGEVVAHRIVSNGNGRLIAQVDGVEDDQEYFVRIAADQPGFGFDTGNYTLDLNFQRDPYLNSQLASGKLGHHERQQIHTLFVAETQLFNFGIEADRTAFPIPAAIWMTVYSETGKIVHQAVTRPGEFRSTNSIVLQPGTYSIRVTLALANIDHLKFFGRTGIGYSIHGTGITDPIGPELLRPGSNPFPQCNPSTNEYCYPKDRHTEDPFLIVEGNESMLPASSTLPPDYQDANQWYWSSAWTGGTGG